MSGPKSMFQVHFIRSNTFRWASAVAGVFAAFVIVLFGFIYFTIDDYLVARSDRMITLQLGYFASLSSERRFNAIEDHLHLDSRGVQFVGLFNTDGKRLAGNLQRLPDEM